MKGFNTDASINKQDKSFVCEKLEQINTSLEEEKSKILKSYIKILCKGRITKEDKEVLVNSMTDVIKIVKKNVDKFEIGPKDQKEIEEVEEVKFAHSEVLNEEIEAALDKKIKSYNCFDENHPMAGISYSKSKKSYRLKFDGVDETNKDKKILVEKMKKNILPKTLDRVLNLGEKIFFTYGGVIFLT
jgi:hypothetical protein